MGEVFACVDHKNEFEMVSHFVQKKSNGEFEFSNTAVEFFSLLWYNTNEPNTRRRGKDNGSKL